MSVDDSPTKSKNGIPLSTLWFKGQPRTTTYTAHLRATDVRYSADQFRLSIFKIQQALLSKDGLAQLSRLITTNATNSTATTHLLGHQWSPQMNQHHRALPPPPTPLLLTLLPPLRILSFHLHYLQHVFDMCCEYETPGTGVAEWRELVDVVAACLCVYDVVMGWDDGKDVGNDATPHHQLLAVEDLPFARNTTPYAPRCPELAELLSACVSASGGDVSGERSFEKGIVSGFNAVRMVCENVRRSQEEVERIVEGLEGMQQTPPPPSKVGKLLGQYLKALQQTDVVVRALGGRCLTNIVDLSDVTTLRKDLFKAVAFVDNTVKWEKNSTGGHIPAEASDALSSGVPVFSRQELFTPVLKETVAVREELIRRGRIMSNLKSLPSPSSPIMGLEVEEMIGFKTKSPPDDVDIEIKRLVGVHSQLLSSYVYSKPAMPVAITLKSATSADALRSVLEAIEEATTRITWYEPRDVCVLRWGERYLRWKEKREDSPASLCGKMRLLEGLCGGVDPVVTEFLESSGEVAAIKDKFEQCVAWIKNVSAVMPALPDLPNRCVSNTHDHCTTSEDIFTGEITVVTSSRALVDSLGLTKANHEDKYFGVSKAPTPLALEGLVGMRLRTVALDGVKNVAVDAALDQMDRELHLVDSPAGPMTCTIVLGDPELYKLAPKDVVPMTTDLLRDMIAKVRSGDVGRLSPSASRKKAKRSGIDAVFVSQLPPLAGLKLEICVDEVLQPLLGRIEAFDKGVEDAVDGVGDGTDLPCVAAGLVDLRASFNAPPHNVTTGTCKVADAASALLKFHADLGVATDRATALLGKASPSDMSIRNASYELEEALTSPPVAVGGVGNVHKRVVAKILEAAPIKWRLKAKKFGVCHTEAFKGEVTERKVT